MKYFIQKGSLLKCADIDSVHEKLPLGVYNLACDGMSGEWYLEQTTKLTIPKKIYGNTELINRIISVYKSRERNIAICLYGLRGSGKTLIMKKLAIELNQPIILITKNFGESATEAIQFLSNPILGDCTILIDEFEKKFNSNDDSVLTLLDGPYSTHHFFILTANELTLNSNLQNRPGRIYYTINYTGLKDDVILDVANDLLKDKNELQGLLEVCEELPNLSFDMLLSIIKDMNLFNESASKVIKWFGFNKESQYATIYQVFDNQLLCPSCLENHFVNINGFRAHVYVDAYLYPDAKQTQEVFIDFTKMIKVRKGVYSYSIDVRPNQLFELSRKADTIAEIQKLKQAGCQLDNNNKVKLNFEIHLSSTKPFNYIY